MSFSYCVPAGSSYQTRTQFDPFEDLENKIINNANNCDLICFGDFNARTASKPDYLVGDDNSDIPVMGELFIADTVATFPRGNLDQTTNSYGNKLLELCQSVPLRICNGRMLGDVRGAYTCYTGNGQSTVDYCLASPRIYHIIFSFVVNELLPTVSDHCSCTLTLQTKYLMEQNLTDRYVYIEKPKNIPWNENISVSFEGLVQNDTSKIFLSEFQSRPMSCQNTVDSAVQSISGFLVGAAVQAAGPALHSVRPNISLSAEGRNRKVKRKMCQIIKPKWFDKSLDTIQKKIRLTSRLLKNQPGNPFLRGKLLAESKDFKRLRRLKKKEYVNHIYSELDQLHKSNPKAYMDLVKSLRDGSFDKNVSDSTSHVSPEKWREHFQGLLGPPAQQSPEEDILIEYVRQHCDTAKSDLDNPFSRSELLTVISSLPNNKAISFDKVSNEMLKASKTVIATPLLVLFNSILSSAIYPLAWKKSILTPLHKTDSLSDPNNFRGLAVGSCLGKVFSKLLQRRLESKCVRENLISNVQGSGKKGSRTADHLLIIRFLIDKYVTAGKGRLFACFFDIRKAFDTVPRNLLFYTLLKEYKIGGHFLKLLQEMYSKNQIFVKVADGLCQPFCSTVGVLQGEVNSPLLFNIFVNKISNIFDQSCDPVRINNTDQNCLLWADDLFVVSQSAHGLQNAINKVSDFYASLGLELNIKKTKVIIFNISGKILTGYKFMLAGSQLEVTDSYQYLGIQIRPSGSFTFAAEQLCAKARKAWYSISGCIY